MKITCFVYVEQDENNYITMKGFQTLTKAQEHAAKQLYAAIAKLLGDEFKVPPEHIDPDGYICHQAQKEEITSYEWGWTVFDGILDTVRAYIEEAEIELTPQERFAAYQEVKHEFLLEDAKRALGYDEDDDSDASSRFYDTYGFTLAEASDPGSTYYVLEEAISRFEKYSDANVPENGTWEIAIRDACNAIAGTC